MEGQVILSIFRNRVGPGRISEENIFRTLARHRTKASQNPFFPPAPLRKANGKVSPGALFSSLSPARAPSPRREEIGSLRRDPDKCSAGLPASGPPCPVPAPGRSVLPPRGASRAQQAACQAGFALGSGGSCGLAVASGSCVARAVGFFHFHSLCPLSFLCVGT